MGLPENWAIQNTDHSIGAFFDKKMKTSFYSSYHENKYLHSHNLTNQSILDEGKLNANFSERQIREDFTEISLEQFTIHILKNKLKREIIGYKLIKPEYKQAALALVNLPDFVDNTYNGAVDIKTPHNIAIYTNAGVLDLWFEPVYKKEFKVGDWLICSNADVPKASKIIEINHAYYVTTSSIKNPNVAGYSKNLKGLRLATNEEISKADKVMYTMGTNNTFELTVQDGACYHKTEDITFYVKEIQKQYNPDIWKSHYMFGRNDFKIKDLVLSKTGCENVETLLSQWLAIKL